MRLDLGNIDLTLLLFGFKHFSQWDFLLFLCLWLFLVTYLNKYILIMRWIKYFLFIFIISIDNNKLSFFRCLTLLWFCFRLLLLSLRVFLKIKYYSFQRRFILLQLLIYQIVLLWGRGINVDRWSELLILWFFLLFKLSFLLKAKFFWTTTSYWSFLNTFRTLWSLY